MNAFHSIRGIYTQNFNFKKKIGVFVHIASKMPGSIS